MGLYKGRKQTKVDKRIIDSYIDKQHRHNTTFCHIVYNSQDHATQQQVLFTNKRRDIGKDNVHR